MRRRDHVKADGRRLYLYGAELHDLAALPEEPDDGVTETHLRRHPLRDEWVVYAPGRAGRETAVPAGECVLCPSQPGGFVGEIPFTGFGVAVFENRYASFRREAGPGPDLSVTTAPARGVCEVVVYSSRHHGTLADLSPAERELLVAVWSERFTELYREPGVELVYPFENRGPGIGGSLTHPHGQIYALPYVPLVIGQEVAAFRDEAVLEKLLGALEERFVVAADDHHVAFVPPFARYAFETWIVPRRFVPGPWAYRPEEARSFAWILGDVVRRLDSLVEDGILPFMMILHASPRGEEDRFHFHVEFYPPHRPEQRVRPHVGVEFGLWVHLLEYDLDESAARLRAAR